MYLLFDVMNYTNSRANHKEDIKEFNFFLYYGIYMSMDFIHSGKFCLLARHERAVNVNISFVLLRHKHIMNTTFLR